MARDLGPILLIGGIGVAVYGYMNGWFNFGTTTTTTTTGGVPPPAPGTPAGTTQTNTAPASSSTPPPLGTVVTTTAQANLQAAANDPYILPGSALQSVAPPAGYQFINTQDYGNIWARNDVAAAAINYQNAVAANVATANATVAQLQGLVVPPPTPAPPFTLSMLQGIMKNSGLSGLGDYQRHLSTRMGWA